MDINTDRFVLKLIGAGKRAHIFPKSHQSKALCLRGPAGKAGEASGICKTCEKEYPVVSTSALFQTLMG